ncbi:MAG: DUF115 domain-containing protein [Myxococcota bacterium]|jgi:hypothetical protein|nr:DUF115 domain-containing protein [Myxococcota bacterium]
MMDPGLLFLEDNIATLFIPKDLSAKLRQDDSPQKHAVAIGRGESGAPCLSIDGHWVIDHRDPVLEAQIHVDSLVSQDKVELVVLFGLGLGYHAEQIERRYDCRVIVFEPCFDALRATLGARPLSLKRTIIVHDVAQLGDLTCDLMQFNDHRIVVGAIPSYATLFAEDFEAFRTGIQGSIHNAALMESTVVNRVPAWVEHVMGNISHTLKMPGLEDIGERFVGKPGILVAAGPSLARNIDVLRTAEGRALVIGLNTSLPQLARGEVVPDMVAVVEGLDLLSQFDVPFLDRVVVVPDLIAHAGFFRLGARHTVPFGDNSATASDWLIRAYGSHPFQTGGSVACSGFSILHYLGCDPIILVGQDLAYTGGARYAPGAKFGTQRIEYDAASGKVVTVERSATLDQIRAAGGLADENELMGEEVVAYGGQGTVVTTKMFSMFRKWFGSAAKTWAADRKLINATEGGARIDGFEEMTLSQALSQFATEPLPAKQWLDEALSNAQPRDPRRLLEVVEQDIKRCEKYMELAREAIEKAKVAQARIEQSGMESAQAELGALREIEAKLSTIPQELMVLDYFIAAEVTHLRKTRHNDERPSADEQAKNSLTRSQAVFEAVSRGAVALIERMRLVSTTIAEEHGLEEWKGARDR